MSNDKNFLGKVAALYVLAYAIKIGIKSASTNVSAVQEVHDFSVDPLEGVWKQKQDGELVKEELEYTIMILHPGFITAKNGMNLYRGCSHSVYFAIQEVPAIMRDETVFLYPAEIDFVDDIFAFEGGLGPLFLIAQRGLGWHGLFR